MNDYNKGQVDLINKLKADVLSLSDKTDIDLAFSIVELLKELKPIEQDNK